MQTASRRIALRTCCFSPPNPRRIPISRFRSVIDTMRELTIPRTATSTATRNLDVLEAQELICQAHDFSAHILVCEHEYVALPAKRR